MTRLNMKSCLGWVALGGGLIALLPLAIVSAQSTMRPQATAKTATQPAGLNNALIVPIRDQITDITFDSIARRLKPLDEKEGFNVVIFELDTPGGVLGTTLDICSKIKELRDKGIKTYAWVNNEAYSAGTIIALATDGILMSSNATIGDCQPIMFVGGGVSAVPEEVEAKLTSPLIAELEDSARRAGYDNDMVLSFIRPEMIMLWVRNSATGERRFVTPRERNDLFGIDARNAGGLGGLLSGERSFETDEPLPDSRSKTDWKYVTSADGLGDIDQPVVDERTLLTMKTDKATAFGFNLATINNESQLREYLDIEGNIERSENSVFEDAVEWLASPMVRSILFLIMFMGAYTEFKAPGFGLPGAVAVIALVIFLGAPYLAGITLTWEIIAIVFGLALVAIEVFVIPGFGVAGISGIILLFIGLLWSYIPPEFGQNQWLPRLPSLQQSFTYMKQGLFSLLAGMSGSLVGMVLLAKYFRRIPVAGRIISDNPIHEAVQISDPYDGLARVGDIGLAESLLRPSGKARFGAVLVDVLSEGEYIQKGTRVEVIERAGNRVVVRRVD